MRPTLGRMSTIGALWREPHLDAPRGIPRGDAAVVAALVPLAVLEVLLPSDPAWPWWQLAWALVCVLAVLWRSHRPLLMLMIAFGAQTVAGIVPAFAGEPYTVGEVTAVVLLVAYSLGRWGSGRAIAVGVGGMLLVHLLREPVYGASAASIVVGAAALLLPVTLGVVVRMWSQARVRAREEVRREERLRLARELHDTVAHHVSGMLVLTRAARLRGEGEFALRTLPAIEEAAATTLRDMRGLVGVLRVDPAATAPAESAPRQPQPTAADIRALADPDGLPRVLCRVPPSTASLPTVLELALVRAAQEGVANARRHARSATTITVDLDITEDAATVVVRDDGDSPADRAGDGYGLVGMTERLTALGGRVEAGPGAGGGWRVMATAPIEGDVG